VAHNSLARAHNVPPVKQLVDVIRTLKTGIYADQAFSVEVRAKVETQRQGGSGNCVADPRRGWRKLDSRRVDATVSSALGLPGPAWAVMIVTVPPHLLFPPPALTDGSIEDEGKMRCLPIESPEYGPKCIC
jgi:hypothetical protein